jgi:mono/diheme cytochrome c family protein
MSLSFAVRVGSSPRRLALLAGGAALLLLASASTGFAQSAPNPSVARGAQVFNNNCQICHGVYAQGRMGPPLLPLPPEIANAPRSALVPELTGLIRSGIPGRMPRFETAQVSDDDAAALVDWFIFANSQPRVGRSFYEALAPATATQSSDNVTYVAATRHTISFGFKQFYDAQCGAARFGNPLTEEYSGYSEVDGTPHTMQLFERARFELNGGEVRLSTIGAAELDLRTHFLGEEGPAPGGPPPGP